MLPIPYTHAWSPLQKALIIATLVVAFAGAVVASYWHQRIYRLPNESILFGTWQMTAPHDTYTLRLHDIIGMWDGVRRDRWHGGFWTYDAPAAQDDGYSEMGWWAGGSNIFMRFVDDPMPQIWEIVEIRPDQLRLRHAKQDYVFRRARE